MKKIFSFVILVLFIFAGYKVYVYYNETYASQTAYAKVPKNIPPLKDAYDDSGKRIPGQQVYDYELTFVTESGETRKLPYTVLADNPEPLIPDSYVKAQISKKRVTLGPEPVAQNKVPKNILNRL